MTTLQDGDTLPGASTGPASARADSTPVPVLPIPPDPAAGSRQRYVVGVFSSHSDACRAVAQLIFDPCDVLVVSAARAKPPAWKPRERVTFRPVDAFALPSDLTAVLSTSPAFAVLGLRSGATPLEAGHYGDMARHFDTLVRHLALGATVILVHAGGQQAHLRASRILLDGKCVLLLTHDVKQSERMGAVASPLADGDCCQTCTSRTCGKAPPPIA